LLSGVKNKTDRGQDEVSSGNGLEETEKLVKNNWQNTADGGKMG